MAHDSFDDQLVEAETWLYAGDETVTDLNYTASSTSSRLSYRILQSCREIASLYRWYEPCQKGGICKLREVIRARSCRAQLYAVSSKY